MRKIIAADALVKLLAKTRSGKKVVFTNGCFDILHVGHVHYLRQAKALGEILIIGLNSDLSVRQLKGDSRPIQCEEDRCEIISELESVDYVTLFSEETPLELIRAILPDILVKGGDWAVENIVGADLVLANGGDVKSLPFIEGRSSSELIQKIIQST